MKTSTSQREAQNTIDSLHATTQFWNSKMAYASYPIHTHQQIHMKITNVAAVSVSVGLNIHKTKRNIIKYNTENINPITPDGETL
ncbi:unnamed protein product [Schistosoma margrebowiei]|uniref:Uncharacterized protein n=1 Tax=Schistosoma margrebowiei TaxID=48269 RepID=A0A183LP90_9TREM|nr:unnamed protein product [Schistosoma margrebowiei]